MNKIIITDADYWHTSSSKYVKNVGNDLVIPLYPKNIKGQPIFGPKSSSVGNELGYCMNGDFYTLDDLVNSTKFIPLEGGYYICYPFTALEAHGQYINAEWKDLYTTNFDRSKISSQYPYKKRYFIDEYTLAKLTKKSTFRFKRKNAEMITIDDVVETLNMLIKTDQIDEYCYEVYVIYN